MVSKIMFSEKLPTIRQVTGLLVNEAMKRAKGNKAVAARILGISGEELGRHLSKKNLLKRNILNVMMVFLLLFTNVMSYAGETKGHVKGQVIVKFETGTSQEQINDLISSYNMTIHEKISQINYYVLDLPDKYTVEEIITIWSDVDIIKTVEPNDITTIQSAPNDELFYKQWWLDNDGSRGIESADIRMENVWEMTLGDPDVIVAVIDMGFDVDHEDIQENMWQNPGEIPDNGIDDDNNGYVDDIIGWDFVNQSVGMEGDEYDWSVEDNDPTISKTSHGSAVLGLIGATKDNEIGIAGVAGDCRIMLIRAGYFKTDGTQSLSSVYIIKGLIYAVDNGARVINISSGSSRYNESYKDALNYAIDKGAIIVCSAGNSGTSDIVYPAAYQLPGLISVGASSRSDSMCRFSNYGPWVDVSAPGEYIMSTLLDDRYGRVKGTSFSAPLVSGVAALIISKYPDFSPEDVKNVIMNSTDTCEELEDANLTSGRVNAYRALNDPDPEVRFIDDGSYEEDSTELLDKSDSQQGCFISSIRF